MPTITTSVLTEKGETMRLIDADALIKEAMKSSNYFIIKYAVQKAPMISKRKMKDGMWSTRLLV